MLRSGIEHLLTRRVTRLSMAVAVAVAALASKAEAQTSTAASAATTTTGTSSGAAANSNGSEVVINLGSTARVLFIAVVVAGLVAVMFGFVIYDRRRVNARVDRALAKSADPTKLPLDELKFLVAPKGGRGVARTTIALGLIALVGVALAALLVGNGNAASDLLKTVVTAVTTALTTVVGFYFGAQTAADAAAGSGSAGHEAAPKNGDGSPDAGAVPKAGPGPAGGAAPEAGGGGAGGAAPEASGGSAEAPASSSEAPSATPLPSD